MVIYIQLGTCGHKSCALCFSPFVHRQGINFGHFGLKQGVVFCSLILNLDEVFLSEEAAFLLIRPSRNVFHNAFNSRSETGFWFKGQLIENPLLITLKCPVSSSIWLHFVCYLLPSYPSFYIIFQGRSAQFPAQLALLISPNPSPLDKTQLKFLEVDMTTTTVCQRARNSVQSK